MGRPAGSWLARLRPRRLGLRARIVLTFSLGAAILSALLAGSTYVVVRSTLLRQREAEAIRQTYQNARSALAQLRVANADPLAVLQSLPNPGGAKPVLFVAGKATPLDSAFGQKQIPQVLLDRIDRGVPARMLYRIDNEPVLTVGVSLRPTVDATLFQIQPLVSLDDTLRSVRVALSAAAALTTGFGAIAGFWASRRVVRPLRDAARAAEAIAGGSLDTRLEPVDDRDLLVLTNAFNDMAKALQARVERDARFASDVSHELRSPLMTLAASVEVLQSRREEMPERAQSALDLMVADVARFQGLVEDLLEISRFDAGAVRLNREELLVAEFVRNAVAVTPSGQGVELVVDPDAEDLVILADKRRLARVMANLLDNATIHGGGAHAVTVVPGREPGSDTVLINVEDRGPGVPDEEKRLVFERFSRGGGAGRRGFTAGAGLGLSLVEEHVRLHGGRVWVEDGEGGSGARFVIELPTVAL